MMVRKSASKSTTLSQSLSTSGKSASSATPHGRSSSFSKTSSKLTSFFTPTRSNRSVSPSAASPTLSVPSIPVSTPGAVYEHPRPKSAPDYYRNWQEEEKKHAQFRVICDPSHQHPSLPPIGITLPQSFLVQ